MEALGLDVTEVRMRETLTAMMNGGATQSQVKAAVRRYEIETGTSEPREIARHVAGEVQSTVAVAVLASLPNLQ